jgi:hypothetical protein
MTQRPLVGSRPAVLTLIVLAAAVAARAQVPTIDPTRGSAESIARLASKPTPRTATGVPDLNGAWDHLGGIEFVRPQILPDGSVCVIGCPPAPGTTGASKPSPAMYTRTFPQYKPELLTKVAELSKNQVQLDTALRCEPPGVPRIGPPWKIVQSTREVVFFYDDPTGGHYRIIPVDGRGHRDGLPPSYLGDAVGRFEGDTLVVETVNFNEATWLTDNGAFHTKGLRVVERLRRVGDTIEYQATAHDPEVLVEPWVERMQTLWLTDQELEEAARCVDRDLHLIDDGSHHDNPR